MSLRTYLSQRKNMVRTQLVGRNIHDPETLNTMLHVPREEFIPEEYRSLAYEDRPVAIGEEQTVSQPFMVALMTQALQLTGKETVLEIGTGSGYQTAILAEMAEKVYSIERIPAMARRAKETLSKLGYTHVVVTVGDGTLGDPKHAPFDAILVTAGSPHIPSALQDQLADGGRLVIPVGSRGFQELQRMTRRGDSYTIEKLGGCVFVPLIGLQGWAEEDPRGNLQNPGVEI